MPACNNNSNGIWPVVLSVVLLSLCCCKMGICLWMCEESCFIVKILRWWKTKRERKHVPHLGLAVCKQPQASWAAPGFNSSLLLSSYPLAGCSNPASSTVFLGRLVAISFSEQQTFPCTCREPEALVLAAPSAKKKTYKVNTDYFFWINLR